MKYSVPGFAVTAARMQKRAAGFTLMELMIVVAIIGILASMAVPVYQGYAIRAQVSEGINLASAAQGPIVAAFLDTGDAPASRASAGLSANATDSKGSYVTSIDVINGVIVITYGENATAAIQGLTVAMTPYETAELGIVWRCGFAPAPAGLSPLGTSGGGNAAVYLNSTVAARHLPSACRP